MYTIIKGFSILEIQQKDIQPIYTILSPTQFSQPNINFYFFRLCHFNSKNELKISFKSICTLLSSFEAVQYLIYYLNKLFQKMSLKQKKLLLNLEEKGKLWIRKIMVLLEIQKQDAKKHASFQECSYVTRILT